MGKGCIHCGRSNSWMTCKTCGETMCKACGKDKNGKKQSAGNQCTKCNQSREFNYHGNSPSWATK